MNTIDHIYGWCWKHEELVDEIMGDHKKYRCLDCEYLRSVEDENVEWFSIEDYSAEHNLSMWKVRQMIKSGKVDARLMDKTGAPDPRTRSICPLKKWFVIVRKPTAVVDRGNLHHDHRDTHEQIDNMVNGYFHLDKWVVRYDVDVMLALALTIPPQPIADWIIQNCRIVLVRAAGTIPPNSPRLKDKFLLYFSPPVMRDWSAAKIIHTILHEAAHAYLMRTTGQIPLDRLVERERQVNRLVAQWTKAVQYSKQWVDRRLAFL